MSTEVRERRGTAARVVPVVIGVLALIASIVIVSLRPAATPVPGPTVYRVSSQDFRYHGFPKSIRPGLFQVAFTNQESFPFHHEMVIVALQPGQTAHTLTEDARATGDESEGHYLGFGEIEGTATGATMVGTFDLPPGTYALGCWFSGEPGGGEGAVHVARGMVYQFTVR
jgi:hypothetical protein